MKRPPIKWMDLDKDPADYDLCGKTRKGIYCDVVQNYKGQWHAVVGPYNDEHDLGYFDTRDEGRIACEKYVKNQMKMWS